MSEEPFKEEIKVRTWHGVRGMEAAAVTQLAYLLEEFGLWSLESKRRVIKALAEIYLTEDKGDTAP